MNRSREKELSDNGALLRQWKKWHRELLEQALAGPHGDVVKEIVDFMGNRLELGSAPALLKLIRAYDWNAIDINVLLELLHWINLAVAKLRERNGLPPFDDALPGERLTLFQIAKELLSPSTISCDSKKNPPGPGPGSGNREDLDHE